MSSDNVIPLRPAIPVPDGDPKLIFLEPEELAALLKVPPETVYQWRRKHTAPPGARFGRHLRFQLSAVLDWVDGRTEYPAA